MSDLSDLSELCGHEKGPPFRVGLSGYVLVCPTCPGPTHLRRLRRLS